MGHSGLPCGYILVSMFLYSMMLCLFIHDCHVYLFMIAMGMYSRLSCLHIHDCYVNMNMVALWMYSRMKDCSFMLIIFVYSWLPWDCINGSHMDIFSFSWFYINDCHFYVFMVVMCMYSGLQCGCIPGCHVCIFIVTIFVYSWWWDFGIAGLDILDVYFYSYRNR